MRNITQDLQNRIAGEETTLGWFIRIIRTDSTTVYLNSTGSNIVFNSNTYLGEPGVFIGSITHEAGGEATTIDIDVPVDNTTPITRDDLRAGFYDGARVEVDVIDWDSPADGAVRLATGKIGDIDFTDSGLCKFAFRGLWDGTSYLQLWTYGPGCRARLGDQWCKVPILPADVARSTAYEEGEHVRFSDPDESPAIGYQNRMFECTTAGTTAASAPTYNFTVDSTTTDGSAVFTAREAWMRQGEVTAVPNKRSATISVTEARADATWWANGAIIFTSGSNDGIAYDIRKQDGDIIKFWVPPRAPIQVGDTFEIHPGCLKTTEHCFTKFANVRPNGGLGFQGFPNLPGEDFAFGGYYAEVEETTS